MQIERNGDDLVLTISRRNARTMLIKLDEAGSKRTLSIEDDEGTVFLKIEEDEVHYQNRDPGDVSPETTASLRSIWPS